MGKLFARKNDGNEDANLDYYQPETGETLQRESLSGASADSDEEGGDGRRSPGGSGVARLVRRGSVDFARRLLHLGANKPPAAQGRPPASGADRSHRAAPAPGNEYDGDYEDGGGGGGPLTQFAPGAGMRPGHVAGRAGGGPVDDRVAYGPGAVILASGEVVVYPASQLLLSESARRRLQEAAGAAGAGAAGAGAAGPAGNAGLNLHSAGVLEAPVALDSSSPSSGIGGGGAAAAGRPRVVGGTGAGGGPAAQQGGTALQAGAGLAGAAAVGAGGPAAGAAAGATVRPGGDTDVLLARLQQQLAELKALRGSHGAGGPGAGAGASIGSGGALAGGTPVAASARGRAAGEAASLLPFPPRGGHGEERGGGVGGSGGFAAHPIALTPDASTRTTPVPGALVAALALDQHGTATDPGLDLDLGGGGASADAATATATATAAHGSHSHGVGAESTDGVVPAVALLLRSSSRDLQLHAGGAGPKAPRVPPQPPQRTGGVVGVRAAQDESERTEHQQQHPQQQQGSAAAPAAGNRAGMGGTAVTLAKFRRSVDMIRAAMAFRSNSGESLRRRMWEAGSASSGGGGGTGGGSTGGGEGALPGGGPVSPTPSGGSMPELCNMEMQPSRTRRRRARRASMDALPPFRGLMGGLGLGLALGMGSGSASGRLRSLDRDVERAVGRGRSTFDAADSDEEDDAGAVAAVAPPAMMDGIPPPLLPRASYEYIMEQFADAPLPWSAQSSPRSSARVSQDGGAGTRDTCRQSASALPPSPQPSAAAAVAAEGSARGSPSENTKAAVRGLGSGVGSSGGGAVQVPLARASSTPTGDTSEGSSRSRATWQGGAAAPGAPEPPANGSGGFPIGFASSPALGASPSLNKPAVVSHHHHHHHHTHSHSPSRFAPRDAASPSTPRPSLTSAAVPLQLSISLSAMPTPTSTSTTTTSAATAAPVASHTQPQRAPQGAGEPPLAAAPHGEDPTRESLEAQLWSLESLDSRSAAAAGASGGDSPADRAAAAPGTQARRGSIHVETDHTLSSDADIEALLQAIGGTPASGSGRRVPSLQKDLNSFVAAAAGADTMEGPTAARGAGAPGSNSKVLVMHRDSGVVSSVVGLDLKLQAFAEPCPMEAQPAAPPPSTIAAASPLSLQAAAAAAAAAGAPGLRTADGSPRPPFQPTSTNPHLPAPANTPFASPSTPSRALLGLGKAISATHPTTSTPTPTTLPTAPSALAQAQVQVLLAKLNALPATLRAEIVSQLASPPEVQRRLGGTLPLAHVPPAAQYGAGHVPMPSVPPTAGPAGGARPPLGAAGTAAGSLGRGPGGPTTPVTVLTPASASMSATLAPQARPKPTAPPFADAAARPALSAAPPAPSAAAPAAPTAPPPALRRAPSELRSAVAAYDIVPAHRISLTGGELSAEDGGDDGAADDRPSTSSYGAGAALRRRTSSTNLDAGTVAVRRTGGRRSSSRKLLQPSEAFLAGRVHVGALAVGAGAGGSSAAGAGATPAGAQAAAAAAAVTALGVGESFDFASVPCVLPVRSPSGLVPTGALVSAASSTALPGPVPGAYPAAGGAAAADSAGALPPPQRSARYRPSRRSLYEPTDADVALVKQHSTALGSAAAATVPTGLHAAARTLPLPLPFGSSHRATSRGLDPGPAPASHAISPLDSLEPYAPQTGLMGYGSAGAGAGANGVGANGASDLPSLRAVEAAVGAEGDEDVEVEVDPALAAAMASLAGAAQGSGSGSGAAGSGAAAGLGPGACGVDTHPLLGSPVPSTAHLSSGAAVNILDSAGPTGAAAAAGDSAHVHHHVSGVELLGSAGQWSAGPCSSEQLALLLEQGGVVASSADGAGGGGSKAATAAAAAAAAAVAGAVSTGAVSAAPLVGVRGGPGGGGLALWPIVESLGEAEGGGAEGGMGMGGYLDSTGLGARTSAGSSASRAPVANPTTGAVLLWVPAPGGPVSPPSRPQLHAVASPSPPGALAPASQAAAPRHTQSPSQPPGAPAAAAVSTAQLPATHAGSGGVGSSRQLGKVRSGKGHVLQAGPQQQEPQAQAHGHGTPASPQGPAKSSGTPTAAAAGGAGAGPGRAKGPSEPKPAAQPPRPSPPGSPSRLLSGLFRSLRHSLPLPLPRSAPHTPRGGAARGHLSRTGSAKEAGAAGAGAGAGPGAGAGAAMLPPMSSLRRQVQQQREEAAAAAIAAGGEGATPAAANLGGFKSLAGSARVGHSGGQYATPQRPPSPIMQQQHHHHHAPQLVSAAGAAAGAAQVQYAAPPAVPELSARPQPHQRTPPLPAATTSPGLGSPASPTSVSPAQPAASTRSPTTTPFATSPAPAPTSAASAAASPGAVAASCPATAEQVAQGVVAVRIARMASGQGLRSSLTGGLAGSSSNGSIAVTGHASATSPPHEAASGSPGGDVGGLRSTPTATAAAAFATASEDMLLPCAVASPRVSTTSSTATEPSWAARPAAATAAAPTARPGMGSGNALPAPPGHRGPSAQTGPSRFANAPEQGSGLGAHQDKQQQQQQQQHGLASGSAGLLAQPPAPWDPQPAPWAATEVNEAGGFRPVTTAQLDARGPRYGTLQTSDVTGRQRREDSPDNTAGSALGPPRQQQEQPHPPHAAPPSPPPPQYPSPPLQLHQQAPPTSEGGDATLAAASSGADTPPAAVVVAAVAGDGPSAASSPAGATTPTTTPGTPGKLSREEHAQRVLQLQQQIERLEQELFGGREGGGSDGGSGGSSRARDWDRDSGGAGVVPSPSEESHGTGGAAAQHLAAPAAAAAAAVAHEDAPDVDASLGAGEIRAAAAVCAEARLLQSQDVPCPDLGAWGGPDPDSPATPRMASPLSPPLPSVPPPPSQHPCPHAAAPHAVEAFGHGGHRSQLEQQQHLEREPRQHHHNHHHDNHHDQQQGHTWEREGVHGAQAWHEARAWEPQLQHLQQQQDRVWEQQHLGIEQHQQLHQLSVRVPPRPHDTWGQQAGAAEAWFVDPGHHAADAEGTGWGPPASHTRVYAQGGHTGQHPHTAEGPAPTAAPMGTAYGPPLHAPGSQQGSVPHGADGAEDVAWPPEHAWPDAVRLQPYDRGTGGGGGGFVTGVGLGFGGSGIGSGFAGGCDVGGAGSGLELGMGWGLGGVEAPGSGVKTALTSPRFPGTSGGGGGGGHAAHGAAAAGAVLSRAHMCSHPVWCEEGEEEGGGEGSEVYRYRR